MSIEEDKHKQEYRQKLKTGARVYGFFHQQDAANPTSVESFKKTAEYAKSTPALAKDFEEGVKAGEEHDMLPGGRSNPVDTKKDLDK